MHVMFRNTRRYASTLGESFRQVVHNRRSVSEFDPHRPIPASIMDEIMQLAIRSPSGFNMTPYKIVLVSDENVKRKLANACLGGNSKRVLQAPVTAVFAGDLQPYREIENVINLEKRAGKSSQYLRSLEFDAAVFTSGVGSCVAQPAKSAFFAIASAVAPLPTVNSAEAWAFKNTMLAAQTYMLACSANGLGTHPMEGYNADAVRSVLGIPSRYNIPVIISTGFPADKSTPRHSPRPEAGHLIKHNHFSNDYKLQTDLK